MKLIMTSFLLCFISFTAYSIDISTDPVYVNLTTEEATELLDRRKEEIIAELQQVGIFTTEALSQITNLSLAPGSDINASLVQSFAELETLYASVWETLHLTYATISRCDDAPGAGLYLAGDYGSSLTDAPCAWLLTHDGHTGFTLTSPEGVSHAVVIEPADSRFHQCVMLSMPNGKTCLGSYGSTVTYISINPTDPNCIWHLEATTKPEPSVLTEIGTDSPGTEAIYDLQGRSMKSPSPGLNIIGGRKVWVRQ